MCKMTKEEIAAMSDKDLAEFLRSHRVSTMIFGRPDELSADGAAEAARTESRHRISEFISKEVERGSCDPVEFEETESSSGMCAIRAAHYVIPPAVVREIIERLDQPKTIANFA